MDEKTKVTEEQEEKLRATVDEFVDELFIDGDDPDPDAPSELYRHFVKQIMFEFRGFHLFKEKFQGVIWDQTRKRFDPIKDQTRKQVDPIRDQTRKRVDTLTDKEFMQEMESVYDSPTPTLFPDEDEE